MIGPHGRSETGRWLRTDQELEAWLREEGIENIVLKPCRGSHGAGVLMLGPRAAGRSSVAWTRLPGSGVVTFEEVLDHLRRFPHRPYFLVEERLEPHPIVAPFAADVIHTVRLVTMYGDDIEVAGAVLRIGLGDTPVDNFTQGGFVAPIDMETGRLGKATSKSSTFERLTVHPVTGAPIEGVQLPDWKQLIDLACDAARMVPFDPLLGWDIAVTNRGPVLQEANCVWGPDSLQLAHERGLLATPLGRYLMTHGAGDLVGVLPFRGSSRRARQMERGKQT